MRMEKEEAIQLSNNLEYKDREEGLENIRIGLEESVLACVAKRIEEDVDLDEIFFHGMTDPESNEESYVRTLERLFNDANLSFGVESIPISINSICAIDGGYISILYETPR